MAVFCWYKARIRNMRWGFLFFLFVPCVAHAVCDPGYYLDNGECKRCSESGYYCPGNDSMIKCPPDETDWASEYTAQGYTVYNVHKDHFWSNLQNPTGAKSDCHSGVYITVASGQFYIEPAYGATRYVSNAFQYWYSAAPGYYLSPYYDTTWYPWYRGVKPCTNLPENAHYTGPGTPDAPDGSITDANDCPWECNNGYGRHNEKCVPLCDAMQYIKTNTGLSFNLYPVPYSAPHLAVRHNNTVCYGVLVPYRAQNTINIHYNGTTYHVEN